MFGYIVKKINLIFFTSIALFSLAFSQYLQTSGTRIVDGAGNTVILRGVAFGGWQVPEGYMFQIPGSGSPTTIREKIVNLVGEVEADKFYDKFERNFVQEKDIEMLASWGFNSIRLPLHYKALSPIRGEYSEKGFAVIDSVIGWSKKYNLYVVLDMHAAPGGQSPGEIADAHGTAELWTSADNQNWLIDLWAEIARRYSTEITIGGYDLINEPVLPNGMSNKENRDLHRRIRNRIRKYDQNHIIFVNGNYYSTSFGGMEPAFDTNMVWAFHKYWNDVTLGTIQYLINLSNRTNTPLWLGEFGENSNEWWSRVIELVESKNIGWNWWTYKKFDSIRSIASVPITDNYRTILDYWDGKIVKPDLLISIAGLDEMAEGLLYDNCEIKRDVIASLIDQDYRVKSKPYKNHIIPGSIAFVDYDLGALGISYMDVDYMRTGVGSQTKGGNSGWSYRNDGVDIERSTDTTIVPYNIGWTETGEYMNYTVNVIKEGPYLFHAKSASENNSASIVIFLNGNKIIEPIDLPNTGGDQIWTETLIGEASLNKGQHSLMVLVSRNGANLKLLKIQSKEANQGLRIFSHKLYPNPIKDYLNIEFESLTNNPASIKIYNINGQLIWWKKSTPKVGENNYSWNVKDINGKVISNGIYFVTIDDGEKTIKEKFTLIR